MTTQKDVNELLYENRNARDKQTPVLGSDIIEAQRIMNKGYPKHMYHRTLEPVIVLNSDQEAAIRAVGYSPAYKERDYPKVLHRRNNEPKFKGDDYLEARTVRTPQEEDAVRNGPTPDGCSAWVETVAEIEALPTVKAEDPKIQLENMKGQIEALKSQLEDKNKPRPVQDSQNAPGQIDKPVSADKPDGSVKVDRKGNPLPEK